LFVLLCLSATAIAQKAPPSKPFERFDGCGGRDLNELLVSAGLARIYGTRTPLPDGRDSREYLAHLHALENQAKAAKRGGWGMVQP
jgi:endonuclease YncB( thermonuclease family)